MLVSAMYIFLQGPKNIYAMLAIFKAKFCNKFRWKQQVIQTSYYMDTLLPKKVAFNLIWFCFDDGSTLPPFTSHHTQLQFVLFFSFKKVLSLWYLFLHWFNHFLWLCDGSTLPPFTNHQTLTQRLSYHFSFFFCKIVSKFIQFSFDFQSYFFFYLLIFCVDGSTLPPFTSHQTLTQRLSFFLFCKIVSKCIQFSFDFHTFSLIF